MQNFEYYQGERPHPQYQPPRPYEGGVDLGPEDFISDEEFVRRFGPDSLQSRRVPPPGGYQGGYQERREFESYVKTSLSSLH